MTKEAQEHNDPKATTWWKARATKFTTERASKATWTIKINVINTSSDYTEEMSIFCDWWGPD